MRIYERYATPADKRKAQRAGVKRGVASGKAKDYLLVFNEDGYTNSSGYEVTYGAFGELYTNNDINNPCLVSCDASLTYLQKNCRRIGFDSLPMPWKLAFARKLDDCLRDEDVPGIRKRYRKVIRFAKMN